ncbi:MAG: Spy/CpxP family protein refolding chaperone [Gemmatimonadota bacterium]
MHIFKTRYAARRIAVATGLLAVLIATPTWAQERDQRHDPEEHLARLQEELDLTDSQVEQIRAIFEEQHPKFEQLHKQEGDDSESKREASRQLYEETHQRIIAVLTEEQRSRLEELHAEYQERHGGRGHGPGHEGHGPKDRPDNG